MNEFAMPMKWGLALIDDHQLARHSRAKVRNTRSDNPDARSSLCVEPTSDRAFLLVISTLGFGMLALLAVLVLAGDWGLVGVLPLFVLPLVLLVGSASILVRWVLAEAKQAAAREKVHPVPLREPTPRALKKP
jgi:hypothetical protein